MTGRVIVGGKTFPNQWVEDGRTIQQSNCAAVCAAHERNCAEPGAHKTNPHGLELHLCEAGRSHYFYAEGIAL